MSVVLAWLGRPLRVSRIKTRLNTRSAGNNLSCKKGKLTRKRFVSSFSVDQTGFYDNFCTCRLRRARAGRSIFSMWWVQGTPTTLLLLCPPEPVHYVWVTDFKQLLTRILNITYFVESITRISEKKKISRPLIKGANHRKFAMHSTAQKCFRPFL